MFWNMDFLDFINFQVIFFSFKNLLTFAFLICLDFKIPKILQSYNLKFLNI